VQALQPHASFALHPIIHPGCGHQALPAAWPCFPTNALGASDHTCVVLQSLDVGHHFCVLWDEIVASDTVDLKLLDPCDIIMIV
jgi:hypothetical protein